MDLDGTSVRSEHFWIWMIEQTLATLLDRPDFAFNDADLPHVSGHSVSEHLQYGLDHYCPDRTVEEAREIYFQHTRRELAEIVAGRGRSDAFTPSPGLKDFLLALKQRDIKIGLVTSGLYEKAWPEILAAFRTLDLGDPLAFYDAIVTAGFHPGSGQAGTLGELSLKPHPWLYAEAARVGMGIPFAQRGTVVGIEDSGAGICALRLAGFAAIGFAGGNINESGTRTLCCAYCETFEDVLQQIL
jgi:beta-phosphoglucomutase-like phosphatase (HAD superfamily)